MYVATTPCRSCTAYMVERSISRWVQGCRRTDSAAAFTSFETPTRINGHARGLRRQTADDSRVGKNWHPCLLCAMGTRFAGHTKINLGSVRSLRTHPPSYPARTHLEVPPCQATLRIHQMSYQDIDKEIAHLELVFGKITTRDRFPLSYWHKRLVALHRSAMMPAQRERVARLEATLRSLAESRQTA